MTKKECRIIQLCVEEAKKASGDYTHGCVIVVGGKIYSRGYNTYDGHAECSALKRIKNEKRLRNSTLYVVRIGEGDSLRMSKPCHGCLKEIKRHGVKKVVYSNRSGAWIKIHTKVLKGYKKRKKKE